MRVAGIDGTPGFFWAVDSVVTVAEDDERPHEVSLQLLNLDYPESSPREHPADPLTVRLLVTAYVEGLRANHQALEAGLERQWLKHAAVENLIVARVAAVLGLVQVELLGLVLSFLLGDRAHGGTKCVRWTQLVGPHEDVQLFCMRQVAQRVSKADEEVRGRVRYGVCQRLTAEKALF